jgi:hypothetical protein
MDLLKESRQPGYRTVVGSQYLQRALQRESLTPAHIEKGVGLPRVPLPFMHVSLLGPVALIAMERKEDRRSSHQIR